MSGEMGSQGSSEESAVGLSVSAECPRAWSAREAGMDEPRKQHAK